MKLLNRFIPIRRLSQSLIVILMLISPLSFSTDKISNFTYECPVFRGCSIKERRSAGIIHRIPRPLRQADFIVSAAYDLPCPLQPLRIRISYRSLSRASPV